MFLYGIPSSFSIFRLFYFHFYFLPFSLSFDPAFCFSLLLICINQLVLFHPVLLVSILFFISPGVSSYFVSFMVHPFFLLFVLICVSTHFPSTFLFPFILFTPNPSTLILPKCLPFSRCLLRGFSVFYLRSNIVFKETKL